MEGESSKRSRKKNFGTKETSFVDKLFSWSLEDILNNDLLTNQVEKIPKSFLSVQHYFESYILPLLEETRAELSSSLEAVSRAPFAEVLSFEESEPHGSLLYEVTIDCWRNSFPVNAKEHYRTLPGDIFLVSNAKMDNFSDLRLTKEKFALAWLPKVNDNADGSMVRKFNIKASKDLSVNKGRHRKLFLVFLINITNINRIWKSLHFYGNVNVIKEVLCTTGVVEEVCDYCSLYNNALYAEKLAMQLSPELNESQRGAILCSLCSIQCCHKSFVKLIWGPPGTGKTNTTAMLLLTALGMNSRVLTCAPTNVAIAELTSRVLKMMRQRIHSSCDKGVCLSLGDLLLFGNNDRLKVSGELKELYLDYRIDKLVKCLGAADTGRKHCFSSISVFLQDFVSQYHKFLENESGKEQVSNKKKISKDEESLIGFMKERFRSIALPLRRCIVDICTHLPKSFLLDSNIEKLTLLIQLLKTFETIISSTDMASKSRELEEVFSNPIACLHSQSSQCISTLIQVRNECLSVLLFLNHSLDQLKLPKSVTKSSLKKFCFQTASLIFCTVSSSFQLHSVEMKPLNLLVIDEAAQLKESESTIPLNLPGIRHAILIGDEYQLPAIVKSKVSGEAGFGRSLFERLSALGHSKHLLNVQYRMHPLISCFPNSRFYDNQILDAPNVMDSFMGNYLQRPMFGPYSFINISGEEERDNLSGSWRNMAEIAVLVTILQKLHEAWRRSGKKLTVGIISPYNAQVLAIQEKIGNTYEKLEAFSVKVKSVDGFQGGEEDIIIISTVRSNSSGSIGFVSNGQRTNVALTRARQCLWILGNGRTLHSSESVWKSVICDAKYRSCFFNADEDVDLGNAIIKVTKDVIQLDDLCIADSLPYKKSRWKILISDDFVSSFGKLNSEKAKKMVISYLLELSSGWRPRRKDNSGCESSSQIIKCYNVGLLFLVCIIDIETDLKHFQVLKVWNILPPEDVPSLVQWLDGATKKYTDKFVNYCKRICLEGNLEVPMSWTKSNKLVQFKDIELSKKESIVDTDIVDRRSYDETADVKARLSSMRFYLLSHSIVCQLLALRGVGKFDLQYQEPGHVSESEILLYPRSTFVVGRPSSRKLGVLVMKMLNNEKVEIAANTDITKRSAVQQIFVCVTPKTCATVRQYVSQIKSGKATVSKTTSIDVHDVEDAESILDIPYSFDIHSPESSYPLVITFRQFLMMLDASVGCSFFERFLILSGLGIKSRIFESVALRTLIRTKEVTGERFISSYWHLFDGQLTKKLDPFKVFIEITFCIKGSLQRGDSFDGILSREDYGRLSRVQTTLLNRKKKMRIYEIFLHYEKRKAENGEFDLADLTIDIHRRLNENKYELKLMDFVFVDEVQELSMKQISLFRIICKDLEKGLVFSSDMANTIASQIGFQFKEIRSLYCRQFLLTPMKEGDHKGTISRELSDIFHLNQNIHTSLGVLRLSQSIMDILFRFFPSSVDILSPEKSHLSHTTGEVPILVTPKEGQSMIMSILDKNEDAGRTSFNFGAEQVLLVRDNYTRNELAAVVGEKALVLTIMESQGLEFQDVFLYNFFCSSPLIEDEWRVILEYMKEQNILESTPDRSIPIFHPAKHGNLCWELKQLYTAITRARNRLWILENTVELSCPIFDYWEKLSYVHVRQLDDSFVEAIQSTSTRKEWSSQGIKLYSEGLYDKAEMCFAKARDVRRGKWAKAAGLRAAASHVRALQPEVARESIKKAAELFGEIGRFDSVARCLIEAEEYERAGMIFMKNSRKEDAGDCFSLAASYKCAAEAYPGNFVEAEGTSRMKHRILQEVDLLEKADRYKDASMLILLYVFANSLWVSENKGWPLKPFRGKERLLRKAKNLAKNDSESFHEVVCLEADILSNQEKIMTDLISNFIASDKHKTLASSMLSARKIIDAHTKTDIEKFELGHDISLRECSDEMLFAETLCVESLVYFWNFWSEKVLRIIEYLASLYTGYVSEHASCDAEEFCLKYLGVRKKLTGELLVYSLFNSDACWTKNHQNGSAQQHDTSVTMDATQFVAAATRFWCSELLFVGLKVLKYLNALHMMSIEKSLSLFCQTISAIHIFKVAKFLSASKILKSVSDSNELENFMVSSSECFLGNIFSHKFTTYVDENMVALRGTQVSRDILKDVLSRKSASESYFSYGKIEEVVMIMLGSGTFSVELCERVANRFRTNQAWKPFIDKLIETYIEAQSPEEIVGTVNLERSVEKYSLVVKLHEALKITYNTSKEFDCASPDCFLYILERLQILVSEFQGCFYTTKFSLIEWLICVEWSVSSSTRLPDDMEASLRRACDFMVQIIKQIVVNKCDTVEWIEKSKTKLEEFYPQLVLRLVILLCLVCINSGKYHEVLYDLLGNTDVRSQLPLEFYNTLQRKRKRDGKFLPNFAEAMEKTGNSLVVVNVGDHCLKPVRQNVISVTMKDIKCREDAMKIVFPKKLKDVIDHSDAVQLRSPKMKSRWCVKTENLSKSNEPKEIHRQLWDIFDNLLSVADGKDWKSPMIKENLPKDLAYIGAALMRNLLKYKTEGSLIEEVNSMLDELKELSGALNLSDQQHERNASQVKRLRRKLHLRRLRLAPLLDHLHCSTVDEVQAHNSAESSSTKRCEDNQCKAVEKSTLKKTSEGGSPCDQQHERNASQVKRLRRKRHSRRLKLAPLLDHLHCSTVDEVQAHNSAESSSTKRCEDNQC